jgi:hypothetical protein
VFDNYAYADVHYNNGTITLSGLATAGDASRDGYVDGNDLNIILTHWNTGTTYDTGDITLDGTVDGNDLNVILTHWNEGIAGQGAGAVGGAVPEPMTLTLLGLGAVGLLKSRRRN